MNYKKLSRIVGNPRHISGIYNYCDRWCERCPFTLRCSVYAVGQAEGEGRIHERQHETLWPRLEALAAAGKDVIGKHADHPGVGPVENPTFKVPGRPIERHRVGAAAKRYMEFAHKFVEQRLEEFPQLAPPSEGDGVSLAEAFDVISFYHYLIPVKLSRSLRWDEFDEEMANDPDLADMPRDQDGSAKIALIAIDRSILAWLVFRQKEPATADAALSAIMTLSRLRAAVEKEMPNARAFVRPGFDTVRFGKK
jgi:hypothetical protein